MSSFFIPLAVVSSAGFQCFNSALDLGYVPLPPGKYASTDRHRWRNAATSCFNGVVVSALVVYCLFVHPESWHEPQTYYSVLAEACLSIISGYLVYDTWDIVIHTGLVKKWTVLLHHIIVAFLFYMLCRERLEIGSCIISLLTEVSAIFLHSRQLLLIHGFSKSSPVYRVHKLFTIVTGVSCRLVPVAYVCYLSFFRMQPEMPVMLAVALPLLTLAVLVINCTMITRLIRSDFLSTRTNKVDFIMEN
ncbi:TLC domain-containing protein 2-like [Patiria miniata]|uniref:TLC domain-containing protein n=1 Tax=Patiria miniata TaxID=46514 RepID=A0A914BM91_PATMI|nr:TLC domain-containing protein 2-like [Patiria miniata]